GAGSWFSDKPVLDPETFTMVRQLMAEHRAMTSTLAGRRALLCEIVRVMTERNYRALAESAQWRLHMGLAPPLRSTRTGDARRPVAAPLGEAPDRSRATMVAMFESLRSELGLRMRDPARTAEHLQLAGGLLVQSLALRNVQVQAAMGAAGGADASGPGSPDGASAVVKHVDDLL